MNKTCPTICWGVAKATDRSSQRLCIGSLAQATFERFGGRGVYATTRTHSHEVYSTGLRLVAAGVSCAIAIFSTARIGTRPDLRTRNSLHQNCYREVVGIKGRGDKPLPGTTELRLQKYAACKTNLICDAARRLYIEESRSDAAYKEALSALWSSA